MPIVYIQLNVVGIASLQKNIQCDCGKACDRTTMHIRGDIKWGNRRDKDIQNTLSGPFTESNFLS